MARFVSFAFGDEVRLANRNLALPVAIPASDTWVVTGINITPTGTIEYAVNGSYCYLVQDFFVLVRRATEASAKLAFDLLASRSSGSSKDDTAAASGDGAVAEGEDWQDSPPDEDDDAEDDDDEAGCEEPLASLPKKQRKILADKLAAIHERGVAAVVAETRKTCKQLKAKGRNKAAKFLKKHVRSMIAPAFWDR